MGKICTFHQLLLFKTESQLFLQRWFGISAYPVDRVAAKRSSLSCQVISCDQNKSDVPEHLIPQTF